MTEAKPTSGYWLHSRRAIKGARAWSKTHYPTALAALRQHQDNERNGYDVRIISAETGFRVSAVSLICLELSHCVAIVPEGYAAALDAAIEREARRLYDVYRALGNGPAFDDLDEKAIAGWLAVGAHSLLKPGAP
jgi:hypothetical protein